MNVKERPILFTGPMVRGILEDRKSKTRRVMKSQPYTLRTEGFGYPTKAGGFVSIESPHCLNECPYGQPGDRLWVREAYWAWGKWGPNGLTKTGRKRWKFVAVGTSLRFQENQPKTTAKRDGECGWVYRHARYMPKRHSRITLEITDLRGERVQDISEEDAIAEGIEPIQGGTHLWMNYSNGLNEPDWFRSPIDSFHSLWDSINAKRKRVKFGGLSYLSKSRDNPYSWQNNPWVWCVSFRRVS